MITLTWSGLGLWVIFCLDFCYFSIATFVTFYNHRPGESAPCPQKHLFSFLFLSSFTNWRGQGSFLTGKRESPLKRLLPHFLLACCVKKLQASSLVKKETKMNSSNFLWSGVWPPFFLFLKNLICQLRYPQWLAYIKRSINTWVNGWLY